MAKEPLTLEDLLGKLKGVPESDSARAGNLGAIAIGLKGLMDRPVPSEEISKILEEFRDDLDLAIKKYQPA